MATTGRLGSTLFKLTWKRWVTPLGVSRFRLRGSALLTSETGSTGSPKGWPTPTSALADKNVRTEEGAMNEIERGKSPDLGAMACLSGWPTPTASIQGSPESPEARKARGYNAGLSPMDAASLAAWVTPTSRDHKDGPNLVAQRNGKDRIDQLPRQAYLSAWPTPTAQSPNSLRGQGQDPMKRKDQGHTINLTDAANYVRTPPQPARLTASGELLTGSCAGMDVGGQLNPAFSRWLQGYPKAWDEAAIQAFRSMPTPRRKAASTGSAATETPST